jgi:ketosteroid isomerase-like protein
MTNAADMKKTVRALYKARCAGDLEGTLKDIADDGVFKMNARGIPVQGAGEAVIGKAAVRAAVAQLIKDWKFDDWKERSLLVEGDKALLHWQADVTYNKTGKHALMHCFDIITFRDGKITTFRQSTDTAMMMKLAG